MSHKDLVHLKEGQYEGQWNNVQLFDTKLREGGFETVIIPCPGSVDTSCIKNGIEIGVEILDSELYGLWLGFDDLDKEAAKTILDKILQIVKEIQGE